MKRRARVGFGAIFVACLFLLAGSFATAMIDDAPVEDDETVETVSNVTTAHRNLTVFTTQGTTINGKDATLQAVTANESVAYYEDNYSAYFDVDPVTDDGYDFDTVPAGRYTVEYVAAELLRGEACRSFVSDSCTRNVVQRVNLSTGESTRVYSAATPGVDATRYHDADRINETHIVVADILRDRVLVVDTRTDEVTWRWNATDHFDVGGVEPSSDWTHLNDVEVLDDGTMMLSLRNLDQVVFVSPGDGVQENRTLGGDENQSILYEQHNPDYLSNATEPTVLIADSENNRIVEYRHTDGTWSGTWLWRDAPLQWPRDADRLPNGNTLIVDSHGERVLEIDRGGQVIWEVEATMPYDAERIGTGDESSGPALGEPESDEQSTTAADGEDDHVGSVGATGRFWITMKSLTPPILVNSALYVAPAWVGFTDLVFGLLALVAGLCWGGLELRWSSYSVADAGRRMQAKLDNRLS